MASLHYNINRNNVLTNSSAALPFQNIQARLKQKLIRLPYIMQPLTKVLPVFLPALFVLAGLNTAFISSITQSMSCKKGLAVFPSPAGMSLTKLSPAGNNLPSPSPWKVSSKKIQESHKKKFTVYTVKKVLRYSRLQPGWYFPTLLGWE